MLVRRECDLSIRNRWGDLAEDEATDEKTRLEFSVGNEDRQRLYGETPESTGKERALTQKHRELVLAFLDLRSLCQVSQVCYRWHRATDCPALWRRLGVSRWELSLQTTVGLGAVAPMSLVASRAEAASNVVRRPSSCDQRVLACSSVTRRSIVIGHERRPQTAKSSSRVLVFSS
ncbi:hypothetical protein PINS_up010919 [Pythium insidiosum]|nr:hypothetical protein PINS_up010919 [Pythium insidiosum]